ncbi:hypothetical protein ACC672_37620, partial [Rhizobium ruizarguesonis]
LHPELQRQGGELPELRHRQWIVMNSEDRHRPEIRTVADLMTKLIRSFAAFAGSNNASQLGLSSVPRAALTLSTL